MNPSSFHVLVTAAHWAPEAQAQVQAAGGQIHFMAEPITVPMQSNVIRMTVSREKADRLDPRYNPRPLRSYPVGAVSWKQ